jgi:hypothetical protein
MYSVDENDIAVPLNDVPRPDTGAPRPIILATERSVAIAYYASGPGDAVALVTFDSYAHMLGPPNDEGLEGHPLYSRGLSNYNVFEVRKSSWVRSLEQMNRVHMWHDSADFGRYCHFIITFQDSTFECVAQKYRVSTHTGAPAEVIRHANICPSLQAMT